MKMTEETLYRPAAQALLCFLFSSVLFSFVYLTGNYLGFSSSIWGITFWGPALYFCLLNFVLKYNYRGFLYEISTRSTFLGCAFATGMYLMTTNNGWHVFGLYTVVMSIFHFTEFFTIAVCNPKTLSIDSFILNHSVQFAAAAVGSWIEWGAEYYFFPGMKEYFYISYIGFAVCVGGEMLRKGAMITAKTNFNHIVQYEKTKDHELVTHGVYRICRHPSYVGWFYWSIGTQIILLNPICTILFGAASWLFFNERVHTEEILLLQFFGHAYRRYQNKVGTGLPFIRGYA